MCLWTGEFWDMSRTQRCNGKRGYIFSSVIIQWTLHFSMDTAFGKAWDVETFFLDSSKPWKGNSIWFERKSSSPSNDKLSELKVHTINKFEQCRHLTKLHFHLENLNYGLRKREDNILSPTSYDFLSIVRFLRSISGYWQHNHNDFFLISICSIFSEILNVLWK